MKKILMSVITLGVLVTSSVFAQKDSIDDQFEAKQEEALFRKKVHFGYHPANYKHPEKSAASMYKATKAGTLNKKVVVTNYKMQRNADTLQQVQSGAVVSPQKAVKHRNYKQPFAQ